MHATSPLPPVEQHGGLAATANRAPQPAPGPRFAELLQRGQATHGVLARPAAPPAPPGLPARSGSEGNVGEEAQPPARPQTSKPAAKPVPRPREKAPPPAPAPAPAAVDAPPEAGAAETAARQRCAHTEATGAVQAADLQHWLAALKLPQQAAAEAVAEKALADEIALDASALNEPASLPEPNASEDLRSDDRSTLAEPASAPAAAAKPDPASPAGSERGPAAAEPLALRDGAPSVFAPAAGALPRGYDAATLPPIALPAALYSPEFAQALGAQVSVLARDGVQQAELHLNPAEMGPISVQIELDGSLARVDFGADAAATREVIERGLPELASALREQGLTLAGGGVFQHSRDRRDRAEGQEARRPEPSRRGASAVGATPPRTTALHVPQGRLDLYA